ncbi:hypothetical protein [Brevundimonas sp. SORGH_AS_0993]|uniref:hypothetical protein n=1 Tax=Brevundimonas sp. SORGH_AS_0993 TaxID=3041794 RepID=UPI002784DB06|nr:hypothetical protein [Brevundimonas sp. SORGH_AS_0993]MDQ1154072.1 hypothetical protein [Brevundimonas sp. SORGH_AS_0993]
MGVLLPALLALALQASAPAANPAAGWTWTLYEGSGPLVLANERPDSPDLKTTLQCQAGSGVVTVSVYGADPASGFARITAGSATATAEARAGRGGKLETALPVDHPAFAAFVVGGSMTVTVGESQSAVTVERPHLAKLRRFADRCAG